MDNSNSNSVTFPFEWTVKSTTYEIRYRKAFDVNEVDKSFCTIINAKGEQISKTEFGKLLGFNLEDLAENDILDVYLNGLKEYDLIEFIDETIALTALGKDSLTSKLKYKYFNASVELFENQTAVREAIDFSFKDSFGLDSKPKNIPLPKEFIAIENSDLRNKLQFQLFENDIYNGEVLEISSNGEPRFSYRNFGLQCRTTFTENTCHINFFKNESGIPLIDQLLKNEYNRELKDELRRRGTFHFILANNNVITAQNLKTYIDLCDWKELAKNPKIEWSNKEVFFLFRENGDGGIWMLLSENVSIENIKPVLKDFEEYWNWSVLTQRFDNSFIKDEIHNLNWDFEELSYKDAEFIMKLLSVPELKDRDWDWNYLSQNLSDEFIEENIFNFTWDFYVIATSKSEVFKNVFRKHSNNLEKIVVKPWNWEFISKEININFLYKNIAILATKILWPIVLSRFFNDEKIMVKCLKDEFLRTILKENLPDNFKVSNQKYLWTKELIDFLEELNLINWETKSYIKGLDTNEGIDWNRAIFTKYHIKINSDKGLANVSKYISDPSLIEDFPRFSWDWEGISTNKILIDNINFIKEVISARLFFIDELHWDKIFFQTSHEISFWNQHLEVFYNSTNNEKHTRFWELLTQKENTEFIFTNLEFPWDWTFITNTIPTEIILDSLEDEELINKWNWEIATRNLSKEMIFENLEDLTYYIDWSYVIKNVFSVEKELQIDNQLPRIVACLSVLENDKLKEYWKELTAVYPFPQLFGYVKVTHKLKEFNWDWDMISNHEHFPTDLLTLDQFKSNLNWSILSESSALVHKFDFKNWDNFREWFKSTDTYLFKFSDFWDWIVLSKNESLTYNRQLLTKYRNEKWDWEYLSEFGGFLKKQKKDNKNYLSKLLSNFPKIQFISLSKRSDIVINKELILSNKEKNWDWQVLSENESAEISTELLIELKNKDWNWQVLSTRNDIILDNSTILHLIEKDWDWQHLSGVITLEFTAEFIQKTHTREWNWKAVSRHKSFLPTVEILKLAKDFDLDWEYLSKHSSLIPTKELLSKFENKWHWQSITENPEINFGDIEFIERFADKWDWYILCKSGKLILTEHILTRFREHLKWDLISANTNIDFSKDIIQQFKKYWNWTALKKNKRVEELLGDYVTKEISKSVILTFIDNIEEQDSYWKGNIYHFSHIDNAVEIIKNRKIQSRNKATIKGDAAGNVVHLRGDAHDYARFYFRPQTPTQFYNEFLGKNTTDGYNSNQYGWVSWYEKARGLGFPKCPVPIFFRFSLKEVLFSYEKYCCISNGNMQTRSTRFGSIDTMIDKFGFEDLFYTPGDYATKEDYTRYRNYAQQEFLVKNELSFDVLNDYEIVCPSDEDRNLLINLLGQDHKDIFSKIVVDSNYYNYENPRIIIEDLELQLNIATPFIGSGYFVLNSSKSISSINILSGDVTKIEEDKIFFNSYISIGELKQDIKLNFIDESDRIWFVYAKNQYDKTEFI